MSVAAPSGVSGSHCPVATDPCRAASPCSGNTDSTDDADSTVVAVVGGPGGMGYWIVSVDGSVEVVGTNIVPPLGESEPLTDSVRTAYEGAPGAPGIWLELVNGTKVAIGDPGPRIFNGHERPPGWPSGLGETNYARQVG